MSSSSSSNNSSSEDWEEWDGRSPFWAHCVAGSLAGVAEHGAIYPLDTVRTHIQVCAACIQKPKTSLMGSSSSTNGGLSSAIHKQWTTAQQQQNQRLPLGMWQTIRHLVSEPVLVAPSSSSSPSSWQQHPPTVQLPKTAGFGRLFRGLKTVLVGCVPAHALYFSTYELVKKATATDGGTTSFSSGWGTSFAGAAAVTAHDSIMTPLDTIKQRLQIGHYPNKSLSSAIWDVYRTEGLSALYRSFPVTLLSNIPYGMIMVTTNELCKDRLSSSVQYSGSTSSSHHQWQVVLLSSSMGGFVASAATTPLDRIKTALQTQALQPVVCVKTQLPTTLASSSSCPYYVKHPSWREAASSIYRNEGLAGFWRGVTPRVLSHTPAVAISWTTYETAKQYLLAL